MQHCLLLKTFVTALKRSMLIAIVMLTHFEGRVQARLGPPVETAMSANHGCSVRIPCSPFQHAATAPAADVAMDKVATQDLAVPKEENDRQEAAADNQLELQLHESQDDMPILQQQGTMEHVTAGSGLVQSPHVVQESEDGMGPISKVCPSNDFCSRHAALCMLPTRTLVAARCSCPIRDEEWCSRACCF